MAVPKRRCSAASEKCDLLPLGYAIVPRVAFSSDVGQTMDSYILANIIRLHGQTQATYAVSAADQNLPACEQQIVMSVCHYAQTPLIRFVVDLLYNFSICCGLVVDFKGLGVT